MDPQTIDALPKLLFSGPPAPFLYIYILLFSSSADHVRSSRPTLRFQLYTIYATSIRQAVLGPPPWLSPGPRFPQGQPAKTIIKKSPSAFVQIEYVPDIAAPMWGPVSLL